MGSHHLLVLSFSAPFWAAVSPAHPDRADLEDDVSMMSVEKRILIWRDDHLGYFIVRVSLGRE